MKHLPLRFLSILALALTAALPLRADDHGFTGEIGLQMYSLRNQATKDGYAWALDKTKEFGIHEVELAGTYNLFPDQFLDELKKRDLKAVSAHYPYARWKNDLDNVVNEVVALHLEYAGCPWIDHIGKFSEHTCNEAADVFNKAGEALAKHGVKFFYHTHGYEFEPWKDGTLFDLLVQETKPEFVNYEMDIMWVFFPGQDPVKLLEKYPNRWCLMHLKDLKQGVATGALTGHTDQTNDVTLGTGQLPLPEILHAAEKVGIKHYFIEDENPTLSVEQIPNSMAYLKRIKW